MTTNSSSINSNLSRRSVGYGDVVTSSNSLVERSTAIRKTQLGKQIGHSISGIETITEEITKILPVVDGKLKDVPSGQQLGEFIVGPDSIFGTFQSIGSTIDATLGSFSKFTGSFGSLSSGLDGFLSDAISLPILSQTQSITDALSSLGSITGSLSGIVTQPLSTATYSSDDYNHVTSGKSFARIRSDSPIATQVLKNKYGTSSLGSYTSEIEAGLEEKSAGSFNFDILIGSTPEALNQGLKPYAGLDHHDASVLSTLQNLAPVGLKQYINNNTFDTNFISEFENALNTFTQGLSQSASGFLGSLNNVIDDITGSIESTLTSISGLTNIDSSVYTNIRRSLQNGDLQGAVNTVYDLLPASEQTAAKLAEIEDSLGKIDVSVTGNMGSSNVSTTDTNLLGTNDDGYTFSYVNSEQELLAEFKAATREITEVVVHWTGHFIDQSGVGAEIIHEEHKAAGQSGIGYHYIIRRDGTLQRGRGINRTGAHAGISSGNSHDLYTIGVAFVAGYNCVSGTPNYNSFIGAGSINSAQWLSFNHFMKAFYRAFPYGQAFGHMDIPGSGTIDPGFNVAHYIQNHYQKKNDITASEGPLSREELLAYSSPSETGNTLSEDTSRAGPRRDQDPPGTRSTAPIMAVRADVTVV